MTADTLTGKLVMMQPTFGVMHTRLALDGGIDNPQAALDEMGWDNERLLGAVYSGDVMHETVAEVTTADVPPPRDDADHKHVLIIGEVEVSEDSVDITTYDEDEWETEFLGKDMEMVDEMEK